VGVLAGLPAFSVGGLELRVDVDGGVERFGGTVGSPNTAAAFLALFLPVCLALAVAPAGRGLRRLGMAAFALGLVALVTTLGRGGWVSTLVGIGVFVIVANRRRWPGTTALAGPLAVMVLLVAVLGGAVATRLSADDNGAAASRIPLLELAATMARDHPLLGVGANNEAVAAEPYRTRDVASRWDYTVHNTYALVLVETGAGGLLAFAAFLAGGIANGRRAMAQPDDPVPAILAAGLTAGLAGVMVNMLSEPLNGRSSLQGLVLVVALLTAMAATARAGTAAS